MDIVSLLGKRLNASKKVARIRNFAVNSLKSAICFFVEKSGALFFYRRCRRRGSLTILMYHKINKHDYDPLGLIIIPDIFQKQIEYLVENFKIISLTEAVARILKGMIDQDYVVITFDDGYHDNYFFAFPILQRYAAPATIFVTYDAIESGTIGWHLFDNAILQSPKTDLDLDEFNLGHYSLATDNDKVDAIIALHRRLKTAKNDFRQAVQARVLTEHGISDTGERIMLTWEEIREMHQSGLITIGAHTLTHPILTRISREEALVEIHDSKVLLEKKLECPVEFFAYPNGGWDDFNEDIMAMVKACGYRAACSTISHEHFDKIDLYSLPRTDVTNNVSRGVFGGFSRSLFAVKISGMLDGLLFRS